MSRQLKQYRQRGERITRGYLQNKFDETIHNIYTSHFYAYEEKNKDAWSYTWVYAESCAGYFAQRVIKYTQSVKH